LRYGALRSPAGFRLQLGPSAFPEHQATLFLQIMATKNRHNLFYEIIPFRERRASHADQTCDLRWFNGHLGFADGALAKHSDAQKTSEQTTSSPCSARQRMPDGTWTQLPCQELGSPKQTPGKSATRNPDEQTR
jgi:hypothetical protein